MVTIIIILVTAAVSLLCLYGRLNFNALKFNAYSVWHRKQWYRMLTYGLVHSGWGHLFFNMLTLYFFGTVVEQYFQVAFGSTSGIIMYVFLYVSAIAVSTIGDLIKYKDTPGYIFAPLYLLYCWYMAKRNMDNIGHTAHFWGAIYGLAFPLVCRPAIIYHFLSQLGL